MGSEARELEEGELVDGRFQVQAKIGEGSQAAVYRVLDLKQRRLSALKMLDADPGDADSHARFQREGRLGMNLRHPNLVEVYEAEKRLRGVPYFVMELLEDMVPLRDRWGELDWAQFLAIVEQVASALDHLAEYDLVHRDLSPWNILVGSAGEVKVIDLGLAREAGSSLTRTSMVDVMGSPGYLPPEQLERAKGAGPRSDQWALAAIVYEALTGIPPHFDDSDDEDGPELAALQRLADGGPLRRPSERNDSVGAALEAVVMRALAVSPAMRFSAAREFIETLALAQPEGVQLRPLS
jgi:serine/threonine-protein kinase